MGTKERLKKFTWESEDESESYQNHWKPYGTAFGNYYFLNYKKNIRFDFYDELKIGDVRFYKHLTFLLNLTIKVPNSFDVYHMKWTFLKNEPFMIYQRFKKGGFSDSKKSDF